MEFETTGGILRTWFYPKIGKVKVVYEEVKSREVNVDIVNIPYS